MGPGSNGRPLRAAVHHRRMVGALAHSAPLRDARELHRHPCLVTDVELQQHGGERLDRGGEQQLAAVERSHVRDLGHQIRVAEWPRGSRSRSGRRSRSGDRDRPAALARTWWKPPPPWLRGSAACTRAATSCGAGRGADPRGDPARSLAIRHAPLVARRWWLSPLLLGLQAVTDPRGGDPRPGSRSPSRCRQRREPRRRPRSRRARDHLAPDSVGVSQIVDPRRP